MPVLILQRLAEKNYTCKTTHTCIHFYAIMCVTKHVCNLTFIYMKNTTSESLKVSEVFFSAVLVSISSCNQLCAQLR